VNADDLDYRARTFTGCIPPVLVSRLIELGHVEEVQLQAGRWEWFCARELARLLAAQERQAEALAVLAPYVATGWWEAAKTMMDLLEDWRRIDEAIAVARPHADGGNRLALNYFARLLARNGYGDEAFALLEPHVQDWFLATALVAVSAGVGRDDDAAALLTARVEVIERRCDNPACSCGAPDPFAVGLLAEIRERQGRIDEAIALLHTRSTTSINNRDQLADLLARHDRIEELREYAASEYHGHAAQRLAELLEERGDVAGAIAVYRQRLSDSGGGGADAPCGASSASRSR
jgi:tetratricopeptide (TPR) repeat protein